MLFSLCAPRVGGWWQGGDATQNPGTNLPAALWGAGMLRPQCPLQLQATVLRSAWPEWKSLMCNYFDSAVINVLLSSEGWGGRQRDSLHPWVIFSIYCSQILSLGSLLSADTLRNLAAVLILFSIYPRAWQLTESFAKRTKTPLILVLFADVFDSFIFLLKTDFTAETDRSSYEFGNLTSITSGISYRDKQEF